jgi:hypothetical protein
MKSRAALLAFAIATAHATLSAQPVYRCGNAYSSVPCPGGTAVDADDGRTAAQRAAAARVASDTRRQAAEMRRDRQATAAAELPARATSLSGTPPAARAASSAASAARPSRKHRRAPASGESFTAREPRPPAKPRP